MSIYTRQELIQSTAHLVDRLTANVATEDRLTGRIVHRLLAEYHGRWGDDVFTLNMVRAVSLPTAQRVYADRLEGEQLRRELSTLVSRL